MSNNELLGTIDKYLRIRVRQHNDVIKHIGMSKATYYRKRKSPDEFTLGELREIFDYLKIPSNERVF